MKNKLKLLTLFFFLLAIGSVVYAEQSEIIKQKNSEIIKIPLPADWIWNDKILMYIKKNQSGSVIGMFEIVRKSLERAAPLICNSKSFQKYFLQHTKETLSKVNANIEETILFSVPAVIGTGEKKTEVDNST